MKFGINLYLWADDMYDGLLPVLGRLKQIGYDGVEVPIFDLDEAKWALWARRLDDLGLQRTANTVIAAEHSRSVPTRPGAVITVLMSILRFTCKYRPGRQGSYMPGPPNWVVVGGLPSGFRHPGQTRLRATTLTSFSKEYLFAFMRARSPARLPL